jgi:hypothetical protein
LPNLAFSPGLSPPPTWVGAEFSQASGLFTATANQPLVPGLSAVGNWGIVVHSFAWVPSGPLTITGSTVSGTFSVGGYVPAPDVWNYGASPPDVDTVGGHPMPAVSGAPLTVLP